MPALPVLHQASPGRGSGGGSRASRVSVELFGSVELVAEVVLAHVRERTMLSASIDGAETETEAASVETGGKVARRLIEAAIRSWEHQLQAGQIVGLVVTLQVQKPPATLEQIAAALVHPPKV